MGFMVNDEYWLNLSEKVYEQHRERIEWLPRWGNLCLDYRRRFANELKSAITNIYEQRKRIHLILHEVTDAELLDWLRS